MIIFAATIKIWDILCVSSPSSATRAHGCFEFCIFHRVSLPRTRVIKGRSSRTNRIPFVVGRGIFPHKSEPREPFGDPAALAVNQFRRGIDGGKSQFCFGPSLFFSLSLSHNLSFPPVSPSFLRSHPFLLSARCLRDTRSTAKELKFHRRILFYGRSPDGSKFRPGSLMYSRLNVFPATKDIPGKKGQEKRKWWKDTEISVDNESYDAEHAINRMEPARLSRHRMTEDKNWIGPPSLFTLDLILYLWSTPKKSTVFPRFILSK